MGMWRWLFGEQRSAENMTPEAHSIAGKVEVKSYINSAGFQGVSKCPSREQAYRYVPFARCIELISRQCADMITAGVRVVDSMGQEVKGERVERVLHLLRYSPDGMQSARSFLQAVFSDFLIDGNALVAVRHSRGGQRVPVMLTRLQSTSASTMEGDPRVGAETIVYYARPFGSRHGTMAYPASKIVHARFAAPSDDWLSDDGMVSIGGRYGGDSREWFSESPLSMLRNALYVGLAADAWVGNFFDDAAKSNIAIMFPQAMNKAQMEKQMQAYEMTLKNKRSALLLFNGADVKEIAADPQSANALGLREYGVQELGRFYGVPAPLIGLNVTQWGSGIEQLSRLFYRSGIYPHLSSVLDAFGFRLLEEGQRFEVDTTKELRGDMKAMAEFVRTMQPSPNSPATASRAECRSMMGMPDDFVDDWGWTGGGTDSSGMDYNDPDHGETGGEADDD